MAFNHEEIVDEFHAGTKVPQTARIAYGNWVTEYATDEDGGVIGINGPENPEDRYEH